MLKVLLKVDKAQHDKQLITPVLMGGAGVNYTDEYATPKRVWSDRWVTFTKIIKFNYPERYDNTLRITLKVNDDTLEGKQQYSGNMTVTVATAMLVNLSEIFGRGYEPTAGMEDSLSKYFPFKQAYKPSVGRWNGDTYYDKTLNKTLVWDGTKWVQSNEGVTTYNGDGVATTKVINHGLGVMPSFYQVTASSPDAGAAGIKYVTTTVNNLTVTFNSPPIAGTNNVTVHWQAKN
jgi:hypothetical protein